MFIIAIYVLGRHILLPGYNSSIEGLGMKEGNPLASLYFLAGIDVSQISVFSLGLGPWITTMIVWQVMNLKKSWNIQSWSLKKTDFFQKMLTLFFAIVQGLAIMYTAYRGNGRFLLLVDDWLYNAAVLTTVVTGSFIIIWLSSLNTRKGVGGSTIIIISGILLQFANQLIILIGQSLSSLRGGMMLVAAVIAYLLLTFVAVVCEKAEIRLPLNRIMLSSRYNDKSYLPIKFTPSGGMPIMYATSVLMLFQLLVDWTGKRFSVKIGNVFDFTKPLSLLIYLVAIYLLAILFAYINLEPEETAKRLQRQGEYFDYIQPGKETLKVLKHYISLQANIGAIYLILYVGLPYFVNFFLPLPSFFLTLPSTLVILISMLMPLREEIRILRIGTYYHRELELKGE
ncbi:accessory Sec system protein translocase subunit SecY2 [Streptococcus cristatus]|uniref:Accessory Sec system protein translocase subunit SecY2 n=3 Tax=Streptococcus cristatus TaxID=45634 RepID=A0A512AB08_STRCR|nr:accessory Sec system protein translocase subunit SecY2 [Streptococcus cristatus]